MMSEFLALPVHFFSPNSGEKYSCHTVYCKKHAVRHDESATPAQRTLFSLGWPPYCSSSEVEAVFSRAGYVTATYLQSSAGPVMNTTTGKGGRVAYVVFSQSKELDQALRMCSDGEAVRCDVGNLGMKKWCGEYASLRLTEVVIDTAVRYSVGHYDRCEAEQRQARKTLAQPDSDGWVTVARRRPLQPNGRNVSRKKKGKELVNFYQFQQREGQREAVAALRKKFQKDKERVAELRARRRFKPF